MLVYSLFRVLNVTTRRGWGGGRAPTRLASKMVRTFTPYVKAHPIALLDKNGLNGIRPDDIVSDSTSLAGDRTFYHVVDWRRQAPEVQGYSAVGNQLAGIQSEGIRPATSGLSFKGGAFAQRYRRFNLRCRCQRVDQVE